MKERTAEGVGGRPERDPILEEHEQVLWEKGILGEDSPDKLRQTVFFLIGVRFGLRGLKEQYDLRRYPDSQINIVKIDGKDALVYREFQSKTRQGGISDRGKNPARVSYSFCTGVRSRCLVELFRKYLFLGPRGSYHWPRFYVQTDPKWQPGSDYWYTNRPVGKNTLGGYIEDMMKRGGVEGNFKNHSMRKATCTRLFRKGVDPQLIKEQTGHKSEAVMLYKKSNLQQKKEVSAMLSVLPREMEEIRSSQSAMLAREEMFEKKRKPSATVTSTEGVVKKSKTEGDVEKVIKESPKPPNKEGSVKEELKPDIKPSVTLDKTKGLDVHVPVSTGNPIDFNSLQGLINIHFHFHNK